VLDIVVEVDGEGVEEVLVVEGAVRHGEADAFEDGVEVLPGGGGIHGLERLVARRKRRKRREKSIMSRRRAKRKKSKREKRRREFRERFGTKDELVWFVCCDSFLHSFILSLPQLTLLEVSKSLSSRLFLDSSPLSNPSGTVAFSP
jgi:hypothetical protein